MITGTDFLLGDTLVRYRPDELTGRVGLELIPQTKTATVVPRRESLRGLPYIDAMPGNDLWRAAPVDSLVQLKLVGDPYTGGFAQGHTMRNAPSIDGFRHLATERRSAEAEEVVTTRLRRADGCELHHQLTWRRGEQAFEITTAFVNRSEVAVTLEMLSSFSLGGLTPFAWDDAPGRLRVHRFRSGWSAEGRVESRSLEELHLERSWSGAGAFSERFGQVGTMPVRRWFPFVAVEDTVAGVVWGAQLAWAGSWQLEVYRQHDDVSLSGGLADRELGHWLKVLQPGERFVSPPAYVACVAGSLDDLCDRLAQMQERHVDRQPAVEQDLPVIVNEWCTTWGDPSHDNLLRIADRLEGTEARYLVIDAGWYRGDASDWSSGHGDWVPSRQLFPQGLRATADAIRARGLIPGLWFEMETVGSQSTAFSMVDHLLRRDGQPVTVRNRRFWDLNDPVAVDYLTERVIERLAQDGFGYLKVDYNETLGLGCENGNAESLGEGLRRQVAGVYHFFDRIRQRLPDLVIENCASGGHRLEPSMLARTAMSSFSDAHELVEIPLIAANLHRVMLPRQSQIWAVLHGTDSLDRLAYSLAATFLGRMCLSGDFIRLLPEQWQLVRSAMRLYQRAAPIIKHGTSRRHGSTGTSWRYPQGWQCVLRTSKDGQRALAVIHGFGGAPQRVRVPGLSGWRVVDALHPQATCDEIVEMHGDFTAQVLLLGR
jgi:alpha-galactosidase